MADWFKARVLARRNDREADSFQELVDTIQTAIDDGDYEGSLDIGALQHFPNRTLASSIDEDYAVRDGEVEFSLVIPYGIDFEAIGDFMGDFGVDELYCLFAHEREEQQDWETNDEEHKSIGLVKFKNVYDADGDCEDIEKTFDYPDADDVQKLAQYWRLAWNGEWTHEGRMEDFFLQSGVEIATGADKALLDESTDAYITLREFIMRSGI